MTDTDTRAALDAAILRVVHTATRDGIGIDASNVLDSKPSTITEARVADLDRAITAHVEAEVARRLAAAPGVEEAIEAHGDACYERGHVHAGGLPDDSVRSIDRDAADDTLRAAIAADRERAVESAEHAAFIRGRDAVRAHPDGWGLITRPTPDEARRLVAEFDSAIRSAERAVTDGSITGDHTMRQITTHAAILRALGFEA